jgi:hypothetical protein
VLPPDFWGVDPLATACAHRENGNVGSQLTTHNVHNTESQTLTMKTHKLLAPLLAGFLVQMATAQAAELFQANVRGSCRFVDGNDRIGRRPFNNATILNDFAAVQDPVPDPRSLRLAYDLEGDRLVVVDSNGQILDSYLEFGLSTTVANSSDSLRERQAFLFPAGLTDAIGSALISERINRNNEGGISRVKTRGSLQFTRTNSGDGAIEVCNGTFTSGKRINQVEPEPEPEPEPTPTE